MMVIGTILPECLHSLASALKFDGINPVPDTTKRMTASKLITRGSWPPARNSIVNVSSTRTTTSQKDLNFCLVPQGLVPATKQRLLKEDRTSVLFFVLFILVNYLKTMQNTDIFCDNLTFLLSIHIILPLIKIRTSLSKITYYLFFGGNNYEQND